MVLARLLSSMDFSLLKCPFEEAYKRLEISSSFRAAISSTEGYFLRREYIALLWILLLKSYCNSGKSKSSKEVN